MKNSRHIFIILGIICLGCLAFLLTSSKNEEPKPNRIAVKKAQRKNEQPIYPAIKAPNIQFAGEPVPIHIDDVKERFERELLVTGYRHSNTFLMLKRQSRWFPVIEPILAEEGVPDDFKYLCVAESGLDNVTSPAGAKGFWQILSPTGKEFGLEINSEVDERYHIEKATRVACKYLKRAKAKFGNWTSAAASYNMGMRGLSRQMEKQQETDYYDLLLNEETSRYVFRILSYKEILSKPLQYGFYVDYSEQYQPYVYKEVIVNESIPDFATFAKQHNTNYKTLKIYNPWLRDKLLTVQKKEYRIKIPL